MKQSILCLSLIVLFGACTISKSDSSSLDLVNPEEIMAEEQLPYDSLAYDDMDWGDYGDEVPEAVYNSSRRKYVDLIHTKIEGSFNWEESQMKGKASLTMKPHFHPTDSVVLDAKGMEIVSVKMNNNELSYDHPIS